MTDEKKFQQGSNGNVSVRCVNCGKFSYFHNEKGHNSPHALGRCEGLSWDGNKGQWAMLLHPCKGFLKQEALNHDGER